MCAYVSAFGHELEPTVTRHIPPQYQVIDALLLCHAENPYAKFMGACNDQKVALDQCFRVSGFSCLRLCGGCGWMMLMQHWWVWVGRRGAGPGVCRSVHRGLASMPRTSPVSVCTHTCVSNTLPSRITDTLALRSPPRQPTNRPRRRSGGRPTSRSHAVRTRGRASLRRRRPRRGSSKTAEQDPPVLGGEGWGVGGGVGWESRPPRRDDRVQTQHVHGPTQPSGRYVM